MISRVLVVAAVLITIRLYAQPGTIVLDNETEISQPYNKILFFRDTSSSFTLAQVRSEFAARNYTVYEDVPNLTEGRGTIWMSFTLRNETSNEIGVLFTNIFFEDIRLYVVDSDGSIHEKRAGAAYPFRSREFTVSDYLMTIPEATSSKTVEVLVSIDVKAKPPMIVLLHIGTIPKLLARVRRDEMMSVAVLGVMLIMVFYNFCLFVVVKDRLYLYYCAYIITSSLGVLWFNGLSFEWLWPEHPEINPYPWPMGFYIFGQLLFVNRLLNIRTTLSKFYRFSFLLYAASAIVLAGFFLPPDLILMVIYGTSALLPLYFLSASILLAIRASRIAYIFILGWTPILVATIMNVLMSANVIPYVEFFDTHAIEITLSWEVAIFSLGLGYRFNMMRTEKMEMQAENLRIINEQKVTLNRLVFEQTEEILAQNDQLLRNQEEIKLQNERLETQNRAYERLKEMILRQNHELENAVQRRTLELAQSNEDLQRHVHQLEQFSFIAAHNLRAPVARILGLANILDLTDKSNPENGRVLSKIVDSATDLDTIIHDLGAILEAQKNKIDKFEPIDIQELVEKVLTNFRQEIDEAGIIVEVLITATVIHGVPAYLDSILTNLISNAVKYRADDRTPIILIATEEAENEATIIIHDNGIGFDSRQFHRKLFEPFQRFHTHKEGKGLGMFLAKTQVSAMQGVISLLSEPGIGTHIVVTLPKISDYSLGYASGQN